MMQTIPSRTTSPRNCHAAEEKPDEIGGVYDLLSGHTLDRNHSFAPLQSDVPQAKFLALRAKHPELFQRADESAPTPR